MVASTFWCERVTQESNKLHVEQFNILKNRWEAGMAYLCQIVSVH